MEVGPGEPREGVGGTHRGCEFIIKTGRKSSITDVSACRASRTLLPLFVKSEELFISGSVIFIQKINFTG